MASLRSSRGISNLQVETIRYARNAIPPGSTGSVFVLDNDGYMSLSSEVEVASLSVTGTLSVGGTATFHGPVIAEAGIHANTLDVTGKLDVGGTIDVSGSATVRSLTATSITTDFLRVNQVMDVSGAIIRDLQVTNSMIFPPTVIVPTGATLFEAMYIFAGTTNAAGNDEYLQHALDVSGSALFRGPIITRSGMSVTGELRADHITANGITAGGITAGLLDVSGVATMTTITAKGTTLTINGDIRNTYMRAKPTNPITLLPPPTGRLESSQTFHTDYIGFRSSFVMGVGITAYVDGMSNQGSMFVLRNGHPSIASVVGTTVSYPLVFDGNRLGVFNVSPAATVDITGSTNITGGLGVTGSGGLNVWGGITSDNALIVGALTAGSINTGALSLTSLDVSGNLTATTATICDTLNVGSTVSGAGVLTVGGTFSSQFMYARAVNPDPLYEAPTGRIESSQNYTTDYIGYRASFTPSAGITAFVDGNGTEGLMLITDTGHPTFISVAGTTVSRALTFAAADARLGVFNTTPAHTLDIVGDTCITGPALVAGTSADSVNLQITSAVATYNNVGQNPLPVSQLLLEGPASNRTYIGSYYSSGMSTAAVIQASDFYSGADHGTPLYLNPIGGSVGIGTTSAIHTLDVSGDAAISGMLTAGTWGITVTGENVSWTSSGSPAAALGYYVKIGSLLIRWLDTGATNVDGGSPIQWAGPAFANTTYFCSISGNNDFGPFSINNTTTTDFAINTPGAAIRYLLVGKAA